jgi:hypothetical protein
MTEVARSCLHCEKEIDIRKGRSDRKFCDERCKNEYHNAQKNDARMEIIRIEAALKANRKILKKVLGSRKEEIVSRETLEKLGYNFMYHTHHVISMTKNYEYTFCFNYGYRTAEDGKMKVVKSFK